MRGWRQGTLKSRADVVTLGAQGVVFDGDQRVLLIRHTYRPGWHFPGGGVECGERIEDALVRELMEEAAIVAEAWRFFGIYTNFNYFPGDHVSLFLVDRWVPSTAALRDGEIAEIGFFARSQLPEGTSKHVVARLAEILDSASRSKEW